jgi:hypothetical protein
MVVRQMISCVALSAVLFFLTNQRVHAGAVDGYKHGEEQTMRELAEDILSRLGAISGSENPACSSCHAMNVQSLNDWIARHQSVVWNCMRGARTANDLRNWTREDALRAVRCLSEDPNASELTFSPAKLGIMSASVEHFPFREIFLKAYPSSEREYRRFLNSVQMPPLGRNGLSPAESAKLSRWMANDAPFLAEIMDGTPFPTTCESYISEELREHVRETTQKGWLARNRENGLMMFACPPGRKSTNQSSSFDALSCFTQKSPTGESIFPDAAETSLGRSWNEDFPATNRILYQLQHSTSFWMRTSADGRFVANGNRDATSNGYGGRIDDMQGLIESSRRIRAIQVRASFDPSFFVDNSGFLFQGNGTGICSQRVLEDRNVQRIDWTQPGCSRAESHRISLYQSVSTNLDGGDLLSVTGNFESDFGSDPERGWPFNSISGAYIQRLAHDGTQYREVGSQSISMPFQGDFALSPSGGLLISRLTGATDNYEQISLGYKFYKMEASGFGADMRVETREVGSVCVPGRKGVMSFDDRFWTYYKPVEASDSEEFGFASATDPEFLTLVGNSSNVYVVDFLTGRTHRITRMKPGQYAQFPHFRSDNWLMFMVGGSDDQYVVASDAAIRLGLQR